MFEICAVLGAGAGSDCAGTGTCSACSTTAATTSPTCAAWRALGGGGDEDVRDGILTCPRRSRSVTRRARAVPARRRRSSRLANLAEACQSQLGAAEEELDRVAEEACAEAKLSADDPSSLIALVGEIRQLSSR